jgi:hypothetical protein
MSVALKLHALDLPANERRRSMICACRDPGEQRAGSDTRQRAGRSGRATCTPATGAARRRQRRHHNGGQARSVLDLVPAILPNGGACGTHSHPCGQNPGRYARSDPATARRRARSPTNRLFPSSSLSEAPRQSITVLNLPELTVSKVVDTVVRPNGRSIGCRLPHQLSARCRAGSVGRNGSPPSTTSVRAAAPVRRAGEATLKDRGQAWCAPGLAASRSARHPAPWARARPGQQAAARRHLRSSTRRA